MAKYMITHSCGHSEEHSLEGKMAERERRSVYLAEGVCRSCYLAAQNQKPPSVYIRSVALPSARWGIEIVLINTFNHQEAIKARGGYRYNPEGFAVGPGFKYLDQALMKPGIKGYHRIFDPRDGEEIISAEVAWFHSQGWPVSVSDDSDDADSSGKTSRLIRGAYIEGRPEIGGMIPAKDGKLAPLESVREERRITVVPKEGES